MSMLQDASEGIAPISVIIPTYNRPETLLATVKSYLSGSVVPAEILIVDQSEVPFDLSVLGDTRGCSVMVSSMTTPSLTRSRNTGARQATHDVLLFSDDDVLVDADSIRLLAESMYDPGVALAAGVDLPENAVHTEGLKPTGFIKDLPGVLLGLKKPWRKDGYIVRSNMRGRYPFPVERRVSTEWAMGYFFCVRRSLMQGWGIWFDESLRRYAYAEDLDFSYRYCEKAHKEGLKCVLEPSIYVNHLGSKEWRTPSEEAVSYFIGNRRYLSRKIFPGRWWYRFAMNWFDLLFALANIRNHSYCRSLLRHIFCIESEASNG